MALSNFDLVTELQTVTRRDFPLAAETILKPLSANPLLDGEWLEIDGSYKLARGAGSGASKEGIVPAYPVYVERGRTDTQAIGKVTVLMLGMYEAETLIVDTAGPLAVGDALTVQEVSIGGVAKRGLKKVGAENGRVVVGFVSKISGSKVRFVHFGYQKVL